MAGGSVVTAAVLVMTLAVSSLDAAPLHEAARDGRLQEVGQLIAQGADLEGHDEAGETPLTAATLAGRIEVVELLIEKGADVDGRNEKGLTALHAAAYSGHLDAVRLLLEHRAPIDDQENAFETTPLHLAAEENRLGVADLLISEGAPLQARDLNHHTPVTKAAARLHEEMVILLRLHGAGCQPRELMGLRYRLYCLGHG